MDGMKFDIRDFRRALSKFPTGVTIVTTKSLDEEPIGVTVSSFNSVSVDPPLVLWSVDKNTYSAKLFSEAEYFAVNVLAKSQVDMSNRFASFGECKFEGVEFYCSPQGVPLFKDCAAQFECKTWDVYEGGDHLIIVGEVERYHYSELEAPLVFSGGNYAVSMQHPACIDQDKFNIEDGGFLGDYLLYLLRVAYTRCSAQLYPQLLEQYQLVPEEWRVLTLLGDVGAAEFEFLAGMIGQPLDAFNETYERMKEKGYVISKDGNSLKLTKAGLEMTQRVFDLARVQEAAMLGGIRARQVQNLKNCLKQIISSLS